MDMEDTAAILHWKNIFLQNFAFRFAKEYDMGILFIGTSVTIKVNC